MEDENSFKNSNFAEVFGKLEKVHRVRRSCFESSFMLGLLLFLLVFGVITYVASNDWLTIPFCIVIPFLIFSAMGWHLFSTRRDELRIYEKGFTYRSGRTLQACRWRDIKNYQRRERNHYEIGELSENAFPLASIEKKNGEVIQFDNDVTGTHEIIERFEKRALQ